MALQNFTNDFACWGHPDYTHSYFHKIKCNLIGNSDYVTGCTHENEIVTVQNNSLYI